ncbi:MAG: alpha/beta hydrolase [Bacillota bacterium]|nr:alpha/beta hydrolase [Bacillota bacterium]
MEVIKVTFETFGDESKPSLLLLHGMVCTWEQNFSHLIGDLQRNYYLILPAYDGHNPKEDKDFADIEQTAVEIDDYIATHHGGKIYAAYGFSMGANVLAEILASNRTAIEKTILDAPYLLPRPRFLAMPFSKIIAAIAVKIIKSPEKTSPILLNLVTGSFTSESCPEKLNSVVFSNITKKTFYNAYYFDHIQKIRAEIKDTKTEVYCWCGSKEYFAIKSINKLKKYIPDLQFKQFDGLKHGGLIYSDRFKQELDAVLLPS